MSADRAEAEVMHRNYHHMRELRDEALAKVEALTAALEAAACRHDRFCPSCGQPLRDSVIGFYCYDCETET